MPYSKDNPPDRVKGLPKHAQTIWVSAFNSAFDKYGEERANKIAWGAVKNAGYHQDKDGKWMKSEAVIHEAGDLSEAEFDTENKVVKNAILIRAGVSKNRRNYSSTVLRRDGVTVFDGVRSYFGHVESFFERTDPRNLAGTIENVRFQDSDTTLRGDVKYFSDADGVVSKARDAHEAGHKDLLGMSIQTPAKQSVKRVDGKLVFEVEGLIRDPSTSVDIVVGPSAGGRLFEAEDAMDIEVLEKLTMEQLREVRPDLVKVLEAQKADVTVEGLKTEHPEIYKQIVDSVPPKKEEVDENKVVEAAKKIADEQIAAFRAEMDLKAAIDDANLPKDLGAKVLEKFSGKSFDEKAVEAEINFFKELAAKMVPVNSGERIQIGLEPSDKMQTALDALFGVGPADMQGVKPFRGLKEAYIAYTGDVDVVGTVRLQEGFMVADNSLPNALANSMTKKLIKDYTERDWGWRKIATTGSVQDFKIQDRVRVGYFGDLDDVEPETADYTEIDAYGDEKATFTLIRKGNLFTVSRQMIINDDMDVLSKIVGRLGRSAARTLAKRLFVNFLEAGSLLPATPYNYTVEGAHSFFRDDTLDPGRLPINNYNYNHFAVPLSATAIMAVVTLMEDFREVSSNEKIGLEGRAGNMVLVVPNALKWLAYHINQYNPVEATGNDNLLYHFFGENNEDIIVSPLLTNADDWYLAWKPELIEWLQVNFLQGREEPELFLADNPVVGQMFYADKMTYKIRHEYENVWLDSRGCYRQVGA